VLTFTLLCSAIVRKSESEYQTAFKKYITDFHKEYNADDFMTRYSNFKVNYNKILNWKPEEHTYTVQLTQFSDLSFKEFHDKMLMAPQNCSATNTNYRSSKRANPPAVDWRTKGVVTPVKNQGDCGSCWTFSTTGCLESHHAIATGNLVGLSEQNLVDCASAFNNAGCNGGLPSQAFEYILYNNGLDTEASYPYTGEDGTCNFTKANVGATVSSVVNITAGVEDDILDAVANVGPVSICFDVVDDFQNYGGGVYSSTECGTGPGDVNHAVLVVGYNVTADSSKTPYWIVKNSWGSSWGLDGYFWIMRGQNECGLTDCASYPEVPSKH